MEKAASDADAIRDAALGEVLRLPVYVELTNIGGDHCGMGLLETYADRDFEDEFTQGRASDDEWIDRKAVMALLSRSDSPTKP